MAVPGLRPWVACLLVTLLSLGSGLDTLKGESPHCLLEPHLPPSQLGGQTTELPAGTCLFSYCIVKTGVSSQKNFP